MIPLLEQPDFVDRNNFADFLNRRGLTGYAVEVGTHRGLFAQIFLYNWKGKHLHLVDPYENCPPSYAPQQALLAGSDGDRRNDRAHASRLLKPYLREGICSFLQKTSLDASKEFEDGTLDFVYVDADHREEAVFDDLNLWWPKVKLGGILAGHDFVSHGGCLDHHGVQPAVFQFCIDKKIPTIWLVTETQCMPWSWFLEKSHG